MLVQRFTTYTVYILGQNTNQFEAPNVTSQLILNNHGKGGHGVKQLAIHNPKILISLDLIMIGVN